MYVSCYPSWKSAHLCCPEVCHSFGALVPEVTPNWHEPKDLSQEWHVSG